ncbi:MAG: asparagine synthetase B [Candidatus Latescibacterota bacterium]|nr:MAG: asparagine synthetase B [Candidatus Latescibacterota bacterium]
MKAGRAAAPIAAALLALLAPSVRAEFYLVPMDLTQTDHLKAYGVAYWYLEQGVDVHWLLNYRGGSFLAEGGDFLEKRALLQGVRVERLSAADRERVLAEIEEENMADVLLEKAPRVAIYTPPNKQPWDDAVTLALTYAEIPYTTLWDEEVLAGELERFDWLHLHHEDFTGQFGKFYASFQNEDWYKREQALYETLAREAGYRKVSEHKLAVAEAIKAFVSRGGFLFAMCSATDTYDIALAAWKTDICAPMFDGDPAAPDAQRALDYDASIAFEGFRLVTDPLVYEFSDIDVSNYAQAVGPENDYFTLFDFSAKFDPVPSMLTQNHVSVVKGFLGQTTAFRRELVKKPVVVLGETDGSGVVKYIHGNLGRGTFTFLGGHDPEDYQHAVGDPPTDLSLHKSSPGYRLILNNILFPAAKQKERKT